MGAGHAHALYVHGHTRLHRMAPQAKLVAAFGLVLAAAVTPRRALWAFGVYAAIVVGAAAAARLRPGFVLARLAVVVPFVVFAFFLPFIAGGSTVKVLGLTLSEAGLWGTANVVTKAGIGAGTSIVLAATTEVPRLLDGLTRLRVPRVLALIAMFMVRYLEVVAGELGRMRTAMSVRGYEPRWIWQARPVANAAGALFVRSYERGERIHAAMLARGYTGTMPELRTVRVSRADRVTVVVMLAVAWTAASAALAGV